MDATTAKRKRPAAPDIPGAAADDSPTTVDEVSDAEVEEFYAILRRMRDATRQLGGAGAAARAPGPRAPAWRPSFSWEDFADPPPPKPHPHPVDERVAENATPPRRPAGLDLNVEPPSDAAPAAPATPRSARAPA
ncbi:protein NEGATIVE REGULATOR OF RESISTANCE-like [Oryza brachyantha]|uniref:protein NEGATIVE REGULATOR OF RESISTANCE-like n=1 Tax=Oryza brachyantha TaxID=4533 RepID=UPI001ADA03CD|nr:protein NEGATIVE REGULATOR OF RESISTANCE-like [Oryza brachyantha]